MGEALRAKEAREREMLELLREIRDLLKGVTPPPTELPPPPPTGVYPVELTAEALAKLKTTLEEALEQHGALKRANDWLPVTIDLATARTQPTEITELVNALSLCIFRNTGTFDLYLKLKSDEKKITVDALTYPQTLLVDWMDIDHVFIKNTAQSGASAVIIKFFRT